MPILLVWSFRRVIEARHVWRAVVGENSTSRKSLTASETTVPVGFLTGVSLSAAAAGIIVATALSVCTLSRLSIPDFLHFVCVSPMGILSLSFHKGNELFIVKSHQHYAAWK